MRTFPAPLRPFAGLATLLLALPLAGGLSPTPLAAQGFGLVGGANYAEFAELHGEEDLSFESATGFHAGVFFEFSLGAIGFRPALVYVDVGELRVEEGSVFDAADSFDLELVQVPIDVRLALGGSTVAPYVFGGPVLRFNTVEDEQENFEDLSVAGGFGGGLRFGLLGLTVSPELRYQFGVTRFTTDAFTIGGVTFTPSDDPQLDSWMLRLAVGF